MTPAEIEFQRIALEEIMKENSEQGGLLFPFLKVKHSTKNRIIRAMQIESSKPPHYVCFACLSRTALEKRYNGVFFSVDEVLLYAEDLVEIVYLRIPAVIQADEILDMDREVIGVEIKVSPNLAEVEHMFNAYEAIRVFKKEDLMGDIFRD